MSQKSFQFNSNGNENSADDVTDLCGGFSEVDQGKDDGEEDDEQGAQQ